MLDGKFSKDEAYAIWDYIKKEEEEGGWNEEFDVTFICSRFSFEGKKLVID